MPNKKMQKIIQTYKNILISNSNHKDDIVFCP